MVLSHLPFDVIASIFLHLDPQDIEEAGKTCAPLYEAASIRDVWLHAFWNVCSQNGIFVTAFETAIMSGLELRHLATSPRRMLKTVTNAQKCPNKPLLPISKYKLSRLPMDRRRKAYAVYLIPGGRLLVTISESYLSVVDLKRAQNYGIEDTCSTPFHRFRLMSISPTKLGDKIQVVASKQLSYSLLGIGTSVITVWHYDPLTGSLSQVASKTLPNTNHNDIAKSCLAGNHLIYFDASRHTISVWNFEADMWAIVAIPRGLATGLHDMIYDQGKIVLVGYQSASVWDVPELHDTGDFPLTTQTLPIVKPYFQLAFDLFGGLQIPSRRIISLRGLETYLWDQNVDHGFPLSFDLITEDTGSYRVQLIRSSPNQNIQDVDACIVRFDDNSDNFNFPCGMLQRYCEGSIFRTRVSKGTLYFSLPPQVCTVTGVTSKTGSSESSDYPPARSLRSRRGSQNVVDYSFDPCSGRLCSVDQSGTISVFDYLHCPGQSLMKTEYIDCWTDEIIDDADYDDSATDED